MKLKHIVLWKFKEEHKQENMRRLKEELEALPAVISEILSLKFAYAEPGEWDAVLTVLFDSVQALEIYQQHPAHQKVSAYCKTIRTGRTVADVWVDV